jgi:glyoxylase-like metal-dependent hydrolase (beta-lactamase superfamily II)
MLTTLTPPYQPPQLVAPNIYMIPIPIPIPLRYVNCYLLYSPDGWTLVDTGFHDELAESAWTQVFADLAIRPQDIKQILVTHYHPDHLGAAGWLQELTGAPVLLHAIEKQQVDLFWSVGMAAQADALRDFFHAEGMDLETAAAIGQHHRHQASTILPLATFTPFETGARLRLGTGEYEVIWTPGHSDGLAVFWDPSTSILLANDMILNRITPNVSLWPGCRPNPLQDYLDSLAKIEVLGATLALPGHRTVITDVAGRTREIRQHHSERLNQMERCCGTMAGATGWQVCEEIFSPSRLTIHQVRFAMSETLAHLVYMEKQGRLFKKGNRFVQA